ncbi:hypothetical protein FIBSPDRAFT_893640 [Athelia psychrophila]|uniref:Uncharacterized protein n=1 Tax=Athelia psychrophila TaxID=1759441 RepID=A0A166GYV3_9AGAM|nr:hypothetical protein FIBSPDRAFT_893640 [Fibularhizoctonia sp. CBS 109695]
MSYDFPTLSYALPGRFRENAVFVLTAHFSEARPLGQEGVRSGGRAPHPDLFCKLLLRMEMDRLRHKHPISSIVLNLGAKEMLLNDTKCADRGIPFRHGYLLHGVSGFSKSSLIHARAREPMLDIYTDLDGTFTWSVTRSLDSTGTPGDKDKDRDEPDGTGLMTLPNSSLGRRSRDVNLSDVIMLSLSGLLNAQDSATASERARRWMCMPSPVEKNIAFRAHLAKSLGTAKLAFPAKKFPDGCPDEEFSVAVLPRHLLKRKSNSEAAASEVVAWVLVEREAREMARTGEGDA